MNSKQRQSQRGYYALAVLLMGVGSLAMFSFGGPVFFVGLALAVLGPTRVKPRVFWPMVTAVICFFVGFVLIGPARCSGTSVGARPTCTNLVGMRFADSSQPRLLGVAAGILAGLTGAAGARAQVGRRV
jgi:hypothetical protein